MVDATDQKIIKKLQENSRLSYVEIGRQIGLSPSSVRERVQKLEDSGVIKGYQAQVDPRKVGITLEVFILFKAFSGKLSEFVSKISTLDEVLEYHRITGIYNLILKSAFRDQVHLETFIEQIQAYGEPNTYLVLSKPKSQ